MRLSTLLIVLAASVVTIAAPLLAAPGPQPTTPEARWFTIGTVRVAALHDAEYLAANDGKTYGVDVGPAEVAKLLASAGAPTDMVRCSVSALLVKLPGRVVLIDTGLGPMAHGALVDSLAAAGFKPADITDVLITHSHGDHVGGLVGADGASAFPRAKIRMAAAEWTFLQANPGAAKLAAAIAAQVDTFEPGGVVVPGITSRAILGHTPGHVGYTLASGSASLLDIGDSAHSSIVSLAHPEWTMGFDSDKVVGKASRRQLLTDLSRSHAMIFSPHFPYPGVGTTAAKGDGFAWVPAAR